MKNNPNYSQPEPSVMLFHKAAIRDLAQLYRKKLATKRLANTKKISATCNPLNQRAI
jgi:hypothetical protein